MIIFILHLQWCFFRRNMDNNIDKDNLIYEIIEMNESYFGMDLKWFVCLIVPCSWLFRGSWEGNSVYNLHQTSFVQVKTIRHFSYIASLTHSILNHHFTSTYIYSTRSHTYLITTAFSPLYSLSPISSFSFYIYYTPIILNFHQPFKFNSYNSKQNITEHGR